MALTVTSSMAFTADKLVLTNDTPDYADDPTGYGAPNPEFTDFAHYAIIRKKNVNAEADEILVIEENTPLVDRVFTAPRVKDGWYEGTLLEVTIWTAGTYPAGTVRYDGGSVYIANTSTSEQPTLPSAEWDIVTDLTTIEGNGTITTLALGRVTPYNADVYWSKQESKYAQQGRNGLTLEDKAQKRQMDIYRKIQGVYVADQLGLDSDGEWIVRDLIKLGAV